MRTLLDQVPGEAGKVWSQRVDSVDDRLQQRAIAFVMHVSEVHEAVNRLVLGQSNGPNAEPVRFQCHSVTQSCYRQAEPGTQQSAPAGDFERQLHGCCTVPNLAAPAAHSTRRSAAPAPR